VRSSLIPAEDLAAQLGTSLDAVQLARSSDFVDLHIDTFIATRVFGYDLERAHDTGPTRGRFFGHLDFPRAANGGLTGGMWSITTNPARSTAGRWRALQSNLERMRSLTDGASGVRHCRTHADYVAARDSGLMAVLTSVQGGNALSAKHGFRSGLIEELLVRVTLVHLTHSLYGQSNTPYPSHVDGLTWKGRELIEALNEQRIFVDLAHAHPATCEEALRVHDKSQPILITHTGVRAKKDMWRNVDDDLIRGVADTGGVVGVIFAPNFLKQRASDDGLEAILVHLEHIMEVAGDGAAALGSDYDGFITPPVEIRDGMALPRLVEGMLRRGWGEDRIRGVLGANFLRAFALLRP
jgi:membrane dipeptidase